MWVVSLPLRVQISANNWFPINLNAFRNAHNRTLGTSKKSFEDRVIPLLADLPEIDRVLIAYVLYTPDNRKVDVANICTIADKWFCDTLVKAGKIKDDNRHILPILAFRDGGIDKNNPRVDAVIHRIGPKADIVLVDPDEP